MKIDKMILLACDECKEAHSEGRPLDPGRIGLNGITPLVGGIGCDLVISADVEEFLKTTQMACCGHIGRALVDKGFTTTPVANPT